MGEWVPCRQARHQTSSVATPDTVCYNFRAVAEYAKVYTKLGDAGQTGLLYGGRVSKNSPQTEAYGMTDEAVSAMGLARALSEDAEVKAMLKQLQREMFTVGAELARTRTTMRRTSNISAQLPPTW